MAGRSFRRPAAGTRTGVSRYRSAKKESAHDYRYFPEPDLVPIVVDEAWEQEIAAAMPELPLPRFLRFQKQYGLSSYDAGVLTSTRAMADYFEEAVRVGAAPKQAANWIAGDLSALLNAAEKWIFLTLESGPHIWRR
jgi:aspartyl-tRNA(Asn)/glutamyl-tRNA(Gln) amidotransferase subunit B